MTARLARDHDLVYRTHGFESFLDELKQCPRETLFVYGYDRDDRVGNLACRRFSGEGFLNDLASAKAVKRKLDGLLADSCAEARHFHDRRREKKYRATKPDGSESPSRG